MEVDSLLDTIWSNTSKAESISHYQETRKAFFDNIYIASTQEIIDCDKINQCSTEHQLISLLKPKFSWNKSIPNVVFDRYQKSSDVSTSFRETGNISYKAGKLKEALRAFNLAIAFAPLNTKELGLAFGNRSAILFQMKEFSSAIRDIGLALENNFPDSLREKLEERRTKCLEQKKLDRQLPSSHEAARAYYNQQYFQLKNPSQHLPGAEALIEIDEIEEKGRRLVARKTIPAGTLVLIDKPFVSVMNNLFSWDAEHCHFCYSKIIAGIPCLLCTFTFYCDEKCRRLSCEGSHKYEHSYLSYLQPLSTTTPSPIIRHRDIQSLRLIGIVSGSELRALFSKYPRDESESSSKVISRLDYRTSYDATSYHSMYHLVSHGMCGTIHDRISNAFQAIFLTNLLKLYSTFFDGINNGSEEYEIFIASLILHHLWNIKYNAISLSKLEQKDGAEISVPFAVAVYPIISLCNHSCDPNTAPVKKFKNLETALITLKKVKAGEELCITYKPLFQTMKYNERQTYLYENYNFLCNCEACTNRLSEKSIIPTDNLTELISLQVRELGCNDCEKLSTEKCCRFCCEKFYNHLSQIEKFEKKLYLCDEMINEGNYPNAIETLKPCLDYFGTWSVYSLAQVALELFKRALVLLSNQAEEVKKMNE